MPTPIEAMRIVATRLQAIEVPFAFVGGAVVAVLVDHPELTEIRPTKDVDVIVEIATLVDYYALEERLRASGFQHDTTEGAPICRWIIDDCRVDVMPTTSAPLGMNSKWFPEALATAHTHDLGEGCSAQVILPALFLATKLEAFKDRGHGDYYGSHDLEDIITLVDGRASIVADVTEFPEPVRGFVATGIREILKEPDFQDAFPGHLSALSRTRAPLVMGRLQAIADLGK
jgi:predicted nucleotidyltransferase